MAKTTKPLLLLSLTILLFATTASSRPCKTIFYFSATTTTTTYYPSSNPNTPNFLLQIHSSPRRYITLIFTTTNNNLRRLQPSSTTSKPSLMTSPLKFYSTVSTSFRQSSKEILGVVGALLFGVGCGALTAAGLFFVWALWAPRSFKYAEFSSDEEDEDEVATEKRKLGYVAIGARDELQKPAKEVV